MIFRAKVIEFILISSLTSASCKSTFLCTEISAGEWMNLPCSCCGTSSDCSEDTSKVKSSDTELLVISQTSVCTLFKKPKISFLLRKIDSVDRLTRTNGTIVFACFGIV